MMPANTGIIYSTPDTGKQSLKRQKSFVQAILTENLKTFGSEAAHMSRCLIYTNVVFN